MSSTAFSRSLFLKSKPGIRKFCKNQIVNISNFVGQMDFVLTIQLCSWVSRCCIKNTHHCDIIKLYLQKQMAHWAWLMWWKWLMSGNICQFVKHPWRTKQVGVLPYLNQAWASVLDEWLISPCYKIWHLAIQPLKPALRDFLKNLLSLYFHRYPTVMKISYIHTH